MQEGKTRDKIARDEKYAHCRLSLLKFTLSTYTVRPCLLHSSRSTDGTNVTQTSKSHFSKSCIYAKFLPARRYASAGLCDSDVSVRLSVRPSVCLSHAGIVPSRAKAGS